jgi:hypothetical protein
LIRALDKESGLFDLVRAFPVIRASEACDLLVLGQCTNSWLTENGRSESAIRRNHQQLGQFISGRILTRRDKSTMNLFAIDSLRKSALQWAISSQTGKEQLLTIKDTKEHQGKTLPLMTRITLICTDLKRI